MLPNSRPPAAVLVNIYKDSWNDKFLRYITPVNNTMNTLIIQIPA